MKHLIITLLSLPLFCATVSAQLGKGAILASGSASFSSDNHTSSNGLDKHQVSNTVLSPAVGYLVLTKFAAGIFLSYSNQYDKTTTIASGNTTESRLVNTTIGPYLRYYLLPADNKLMNVFIDGRYGVGTLIYKPSITEKYPAHTFSFSAGTEIYFNSSVGIEFSLGYYNTYQALNAVTMKGVQAGIGLQIHFNREMR